jgi:hypothetical protein
MSKSVSREVKFSEISLSVMKEFVSVNISGAIKRTLKSNRKAGVNILLIIERRIFIKTNRHLFIPIY